VVLLLSSAAALYLTIRWRYKKYPYLSFKHVHTVFEGEEAMAAEKRAHRVGSARTDEKTPVRAVVVPLIFLLTAFHEKGLATISKGSSAVAVTIHYSECDGNNFLSSCVSSSARI
jgi:hypothetical protein